MTKLQKRARSADVYLPVALQAGVRSSSPRSSLPMSSNAMSLTNPLQNAPLSPFQQTHRRGASTPPTTQWPLISTSVPPSMQYPPSLHHDTSKCGASCTRCGKKKLIQLNSPPSSNIPTTAASLRPIPQAHMRAVSEGMIGPYPKRLSIAITPTIPTAGKPPCCHKCGKMKRPASLPAPSRPFSSSAVPRKPVASPAGQAPSSIPPQRPTYQLQPAQRYQALRANISGTTFGTPHPNKDSILRSRSPNPRSPDRPGSSGENIISPLSPRRKVNFTLPGDSDVSKSSSTASQPYSPSTYTPLTPFSPQETAEIGTGRLINLISTAIRETSPPGTAGGKYKQMHGHSSSGANAGLGITTATSAEAEARLARLASSRSPVDAPMPLEPLELDSVPIGDVTAEIVEAYAESTPLTAPRQPERSDEENAESAEYAYDWTDAVRIPVIRLPSVKGGIERFRSLRGGGSRSGSQRSVRRGPSVRDRFGSLRGRNQEMAGCYGGSGGGMKYQALQSSAEVGVY